MTKRDDQTTWPLGCAMAGRPWLAWR